MNETCSNEKTGVWISLSEEDAELFKQFRQYQNDFKILLENGVFAPFIGSKIIHKNGYEIKMIETNLMTRIK